MTIKSGSPKFFSSSSVGRRNMFLTKCACQATSIMNRTFSRVSALVPQKASITNKRLPESCLVVSAFKSAQTSGVVGLLSFGALGDVHQMVSRETSSMTMYLSLGERPVNSPVITLTAPYSVTTPFSKPSSPGFVSSSNNFSYEGL